jgi:hypothetical protein
MYGMSNDDDDDNGYDKSGDVDWIKQIVMNIAIII